MEEAGTQADQSSFETPNDGAYDRSVLLHDTARDERMVNDGVGQKER